MFLSFAFNCQFKPSVGINFLSDQGILPCARSDVMNEHGMRETVYVMHKR